MNRLALSILLASTWVPLAQAQSDPFLELLRHHAARDAGGPLDDSGDPQPAVTFVQLRTLPDAAAGLRLRSTGDLLRVSHGQTARSRLAPELTARLLAASAALVNDPCPRVPEHAVDLELKLGLGAGQRGLLGLSTNLTCPHLARYARLVLEVLGEEAPPLAQPSLPLPELTLASRPTPEAPASAGVALPESHPARPSPLPSQPAQLPDPAPHETAAGLAQSLPTPDTVDALLIQLQDLDPRTRAQAAAALPGFLERQPEQATMLLNKALSSTDPAVRAAGVAALETYSGDPEALQPVVRWQAGSADPEVRAAAVRAQARLETAAVPAEPAAEEPAIAAKPPAQEPAELTAEPASGEPELLTANGEAVATVRPAPRESVPETEQPPAGAWPREATVVIHADRPAANRQRLRVRTSPGGGSVIGSVACGQTVRVLGPAEQDYYPIQFEGRRAYVSALPRYTRLAPTESSH